MDTPVCYPLIGKATLCGSYVQTLWYWLLKKNIMQMPNFPEIPPCGHSARVHVSVTSWFGHDRMQYS